MAKPEVVDIKNADGTIDEFIIRRNIGEKLELEKIANLSKINLLNINIAELQSRNLEIDNLLADPNGYGQPEE